MYFCQKTTKKRVGGCPAVNYGRCSYEDTPDNYVELLVTPDEKKVSVDSNKVTNKPSVTRNIAGIRTRIVYNSNVLRKTVEGLLAKPCMKDYTKKYRKQVHVPVKVNTNDVGEYVHCTRVVTNKSCFQNRSVSQSIDSINKCEYNPTRGVNNTTMVKPQSFITGKGVQQNNHDLTRSFEKNIPNSVIVPGESSPRRVNCQTHRRERVYNGNAVGEAIKCGGDDRHINSTQFARACRENEDNALSLGTHRLRDTSNSRGVGCTEAPSSMRDFNYTRLYDVNCNGSDKYINTLLCRDAHKLATRRDTKECSVFEQWRQQTDFDFGFIPLSEFIMPVDNNVMSQVVECPIKQHLMINKTHVPNFLGARIPIQSQLNVPKWHEYLSEYWDQQLLQLVTFGFPLDFNRQCVLKADKTNHASAEKHPADVEAYLNEEKQYKAVLGPFDKNPLPSCHYSPFMTREKPGSDHRRVIIDLSWPHENSVNAGIHKDSYLGTDFSLTFPTVDHITDALKQIGRGAHLFKIDIKRAFRHVKIDPLDYDLLGLFWEGHFIDTCLPFGTRHGTQIFQRLSDSIRYILRARGFPIVNYVDDFVGFGTPSQAKLAFDQLYEIIQDLGLTISQKKLVPPSTKVTCLGVVIDTKEGTVSIPPEKMAQISDSILSWRHRNTCSRRQLQSLLGHLLYIHKCVKPSRIFVNRMLQVLRSQYDSNVISLTTDFHRDLQWFTKFMADYNGISLYDHKPIAHTIELDACLTGLGGRCDQWVYHLAIPRGYQNLTIVHLEMINIFLAVKLFAKIWSHKRVLIKCDNDAVVRVLRSGRARDPFLGACARNIWLQAAQHDIDLSYIHVLGKANVVADRLSRWTNSGTDWGVLLQYVQRPIWLSVNMDMLNIDNQI